ncbi:uncharacterized protein FOMMEDRAFT_20420 [Fomitiporia mediterranea MF3/22]|uniref:uncharacterized protein n=1 Tax=Fomitiporia mediterranea (strain MF3/22) TaxID=694068 RepID=UPI0004408FC3|nr:uncharacterized protein FOMMEDRAFT_20420 [Fomitiporia mediterranea MF3/22]EJD03268.1 hypothetical protein FOMMEDRAFT_20420 [Fomitiporia mediterranea MF3/22]
MPEDTASWTADQEALLIQTLKKAKDDGLQAESGWKPVVWSLAVEALAGTESESGGVRKEVKHVRSRFHRLKSAYQEVKKIRESSGFGWDPVQHLATAPANVWETYFVSHKNAKPWRKKSFPLYEEMAELVEGIVADGRGAFRPSQNTQTSGTPSLQAASSSSLASNKTSSVSAVPKSLEDISDFESDTGGDDTQYTETLPTTSSTASKRAVSLEPEVTAIKKRPRTSGANAIISLSESIETVADAVTFASSTRNATAQTPTKTTSWIPETSLQRRTAAIRAIEVDEELSDNDMVDVAEMIREHTSIADTYLALQNKDHRTTYLQKSLARYKGM